MHLVRNMENAAFFKMRKLLLLLCLSLRTRTVVAGLFRFVFVLTAFLFFVLFFVLAHRTWRGLVIGGLNIDYGLSNLGKFLVGFFFFFKRFAKQIRRFVVTQQLSKSSNAPVPCHFIMLDTLGGGDQARVQNGRFD